MSSNVRRFQRRNGAPKKEVQVSSPQQEQPPARLTIVFVDAETPPRIFDQCQFMFQPLAQGAILVVVDKLTFKTHVFPWDIVREVESETCRIEVPQVSLS